MTKTETINALLDRSAELNTEAKEWQEDPSDDPELRAYAETLLDDAALCVSAVNHINGVSPE